MNRIVSIALFLILVAMAVEVQAVYMVEAHPSGLANYDFTSNGTLGTSMPSTAYGTTATNSVFGGNVNPDTYIYSYTPGTDVDNVTIPAGTDLGNGDLATGLVGGGSGLYNAYITWPTSTNVTVPGCDIVITNDGLNIVLTGVDMNTGGTGNPGGNDAWLLIAENIQLTQGVTYTVTQIANSDTYVSMRSHGVMWEAVPEPCTLSLLGLGFLLLRRRIVSVRRHASI